MRKGCRASKMEKKCVHYSYMLLRCELGYVPATCSMIEQPKPGTKKAKVAEVVRHFYDGIEGKHQSNILYHEDPEGIVNVDDLYGPF
jgi:hypothetical protein